MGGSRWVMEVRLLVLCMAAFPFLSGALSDLPLGTYGLSFVKPCFVPEYFCLPSCGTCVECPQTGSYIKYLCLYTLGVRCCATGVQYNGE